MQASLIQACVRVLARELPGFDQARYEAIVRTMLQTLVSGYFSEVVPRGRNQNA